MFLLHSADKRQSLEDNKTKPVTRCGLQKKVNLNILKLKTCINHTPAKSSRNNHWGAPFQWTRRPKAYNFPKNEPPKRHFSQSLLESEEDRMLTRSIEISFQSKNSGISQLNQKTRTKYHLENLPLSKLKHPLSQKMTHLESGFWVGNWCQHIRNLHWKDCLHICSLWSVGLIWLL